MLFDELPPAKTEGEGGAGAEAKGEHLGDVG